jgi:hypothetical protein
MDINPARCGENIGRGRNYPRSCPRPIRVQSPPYLVFYPFPPFGQERLSAYAQKVSAKCRVDAVAIGSERPRRISPRPHGSHNRSQGASADRDRSDGSRADSPGEYPRARTHHWPRLLQRGP